MRYLAATKVLAHQTRVFRVDLLHLRLRQV
jgi:hypothetical protein